MNGLPRFLAGITLLMPAIGMGNPCHFNGLYVGGDVGLIVSDINLEHSVNSNTGAVQTTPPVTPNVFFLNFSNASPNRTTDTSWLGAVVLGYSRGLWPQWVLGIEGRASFDDLLSTDRHTINNAGTPVLNMETTVELSQQYSLLGKIGFLIAENLQTYGLIGPQWGRFQSHTTSTLYDIENPGSSTLIFNGANTIEKSAYNCGLLLGLGVEYWFGCNMTIGFEYNYTTYGNLDYPEAVTSTLLFNGSSLPGSAYTDYHDIEANTNAYMFKIAYYFNL